MAGRRLACHQTWSALMPTHRARAGEQPAAGGTSLTPAATSFVLKGITGTLACQSSQVRAGEA